MKRYAQQSSVANPQAVVMYIDMNSFFASCEQQEHEALQHKPVGVITHDSPYACVIAPSTEAKKYGVRTGMRLSDCKALCPQLIPVLSDPPKYRRYHLAIMRVLRSYCDDVLPRSIDEAVMNLTAYRLVYKDFTGLAGRIKADIKRVCGEHVKCSIGIAPNVFLAKLATELRKPDGLIEITPDNIDDYLAGMSLTDLPGIARNNARRLQMMGLKTPLEMRHASEALLRKAFGGVTGHYWHWRLNFREMDLYKNDYRAMSATRTVSRAQSASVQALDGLLISLCTRLEQRMVKQRVFCREVRFFIRYKDFTGWDTRIRLAHPVQDAMELRRYILNEVRQYEGVHGNTMFSDKTRSMGVAIAGFFPAECVEYGLFDNQIRQDHVRVVMYDIKDRYGKNSVRKASEIIHPHVMKDAIGFGSVKDLYEGERFNKYLLEQD